MSTIITVIRPSLGVINDVVGHQQIGRRTDPNGRVTTSVSDPVFLFHHRLFFLFLSFCRVSFFFFVDFRRIFWFTDEKKNVQSRRSRHCIISAADDGGHWVSFSRVFFMYFSFRFLFSSSLFIPTVRNAVGRVRICFYRVLPSLFSELCVFFTLNQALVNIKIRLNVLFFVFFFSFSFLFFAFHLNGPERCRSSPNLFYRVLPSFTEFYRVLPSFTEFYRVLPSFTELFSKLSLVFTLSRVFVLV